MNQPDRNQEATIYIGNLDERVTDAIIWELFLQCGPVVSVHLPKDRVSSNHSGFGFCEFLSPDDAEYAVNIINQIKLFGKPIRVNKASANSKQVLDIGAELFIGNLDPYVDERALYDTFNQFGQLAKLPIVQRDENGMSKGFGFVSFTSFEASDNAIEAMNNQFLMNKSIRVSYAFKKDGKGEQHGDQAERMLATAARQHNIQIQPHVTLPPNFYPSSGPQAAQRAGAFVPTPPVFVPPSAAGYGAFPPPQQPMPGMAPQQQPSMNSGFQ